MRNNTLKTVYGLREDQVLVAGEHDLVALMDIEKNWRCEVLRYRDLCRSLRALLAVERNVFRRYEHEMEYRYCLCAMRNALKVWRQVRRDAAGGWDEYLTRARRPSNRA